MNEKISLTLKKDWDYPPHPKKEQGHFVGRKAEIDRLVNNLLRKNSGSILVSGDRGVGKTSLVYKAIQDVRKEKTKTISVILNASQLEVTSKDGESSQQPQEKIIKNLIRRFYTAIKDENLNAITSTKIGDLYKKAVATKSETIERTSVIDAESEEELTAIKKELEIPVSNIKTIIASLCAAIAVLLQFNPLFSEDYEVANKIFPLLALFPLPILFLYSWTRQRIKTTEKKLKKTVDEYYKVDGNIGNLEFDFEEVLENIHGEEYKIIFVIDELDKIKEEQVIEIIKSFKNLFNLSSSIFILITGKEIFDKIEQSKEARTVDYTLFTHKLFLSRPSFIDTENFIDEIIEEPNIEVFNKDQRYKDFKNYLCFRAKSDFFDLYSVIRDFIIDFDKEYHPQITLPELSTNELMESRLQKAMGQIYDLYKSEMPSRWHENEILLSKFYSFLDNLLQKMVNAKLEDIFKDNTQLEAEGKRSLCKYLARLGALIKIDQQTKTIEDKSQLVTTYQWTTNCNKVPSKVKSLMEFEDNFVQDFNAFSEQLLEIANEYKKIKSENLFTIKDLQRKPQEILQIVQKLTGSNLTPIYSQLNQIEQGLKREFPEHYKREELEQHTKSLNAQMSNLRNTSKVFIENILKDLFPTEHVSQLQQDANLFSVIQELRKAVINNEIQHSVIFKPDFSKQILLTLNISIDSIKNNEKLIIQNAKTLKLVNVQTALDLSYKKLKANFWNIKVTDNFNDISKVIKEVERWFS